MNRSLILSFITLLFLVPGCLRQRYVEQPDKTKVYLPNKKIKDMDFNEVDIAYQFYKNGNYTDLTLQALERKLSLASDYKIIEKTILELADTQFAFGRFDAAQKTYNQFITLYPASSERERAHLRLIDSLNKSANDSRRDQTVTLQIVEKAKEFLDLYSEENEYAPEIQEIINKCMLRLVDHEVFVAQTYLQKYYYELKEGPILAARKRIMYVAKELLPYFSPRSQHLLLIDRNIGELVMAEKANKSFPIQAQIIATIIEEIQQYVAAKEKRSFYISRDLF
jgi:outer membrane protein assembly factor BamD (BamD/ComL family)